MPSPDQQAAASAQIVDTLSIENLKGIGGASAFAMAQLAQSQVQALSIQYQNATSHQNRMNALSEAFVAKALNTFASVDPVEAVSTAKLFKGESDSAIASLIAQTAAGQQTAKVAQSTPGDLAADVSRLGAMVAAMAAQFGGVVAAIQQLTKSAQTTPPETGGGSTPK